MVYLWDEWGIRMSNLGAYQTVTTVMKALGGPHRAIPIIAGGLLLTGAGLQAGTAKIVRTLKEGAHAHPAKDQVFTVTQDGESDGVRVSVGNSFRVLEGDGDSILVEILGRDDNPFFLSAEFLSTVSNFTEAPTG